MKKQIALIATLLALAGAGAAAAAEDVTKAPGYVDFEALSVFGKQAPDVEIFLTKELIAFVVIAAQSSDPELADMLSKLVQIRVQTFKLEPDKLEAVEKKTQEMSQRLEAQGWATMIKVRDRGDGDQTYIYSKLVNGVMQGLVVMNVDPRDEASFINIVGEIDPQQLGKLQGKFGGMHGLDSLNLQIKSRVSDDVEKNREKSKER